MEYYRSSMEEYCHYIKLPACVENNNEACTSDAGKPTRKWQQKLQSFGALTQAHLNGKTEFAKRHQNTGEVCCLKKDLMRAARKFLKENGHLRKSEDGKQCKKLKKANK